MADTVPPCNPGPKPKKRRVHVFGAGIAGMTAAHELALRGFEVRVYEAANALNSRGKKSMAVGGLARTQYFQASSQQPIFFQTEEPAPSGSPPVTAAPINPLTTSSVDLGLDQARPFPSLWLEFQNEPSDLLTPRSQADLNNAIAQLTGKVHDGSLGADFVVHIQPFFDQSREEIQQVMNLPVEIERSKGLARSIELKLTEGLRTLSHFSEINLKNEAPRPANTELGQPPSARNWVRVTLGRAILPGEHGYRYFPSYYRHVFDTMRRIPLYDNNSLPTSRTTYDNLAPLPTIGIASEKHPPFVTKWATASFPNALASGAGGLSNLEDLGIQPRDLFQFSLRILRYMLTSPERRAHELEDISWWDFIEGASGNSGSGKRYRYSEAFTHLVRSSGRVLVALDGSAADARTTGNTYLQLLTDVIVPTEETHASLNGPTSAAWFSHWHTHLCRLGVQFIQATLKGFEAVNPLTEGARFNPIVQYPHGKETFPTTDDYYVVAVDVLAAEEITQHMPLTYRQKDLSVPGGLQGYTTQVPVKRGEAGTRQRDPRTEIGLYEWDRLQTLSGIQYFFTTELNVIDGYLYLLDAPWGLSTICSPVAWQHRPIQGLSQYQSLLSVDIGEWQKKSPGSGGRSAWKSTPTQLKNEVLGQLGKALQRKEKGRPFLEFNPPEPAFTHIDEGLVYDGSDPDQAHIIKNNTPFLLPTAGDWKHRPGPDPWDPTSGAHGSSPDGDLPPGLWQAAHGGYYVHWDQIVFAGTYNKTFTRLTTMESANESARHAVNAILDHCGGRHSKRPTPRPDSHVYEELFATTPMGDYCRIWDPEANELPDVMLLRQQDAVNFKMGLPHPWDLLGIEVLPSMLSHLSAASPASATSTDAFAQVESLLRGLGMHSGHGGGEGLVGLLRRIRTQLEESLRRGAAGYRPPTS
ncbi:phytoene dehydrogenase [Corallococcus sp. AB011P]|uniref:NAD(P)-binding protein n=1 Tax=Corallococcus sp. AB011P TaxID=2316735 RepID=UPI000EA30D2D|nr:NAD(P)-binding protein [Corallococcus sp. AB011P]RKG54196.1 phytoene dehydrogenase [Corallococcus sp. AB011P]